MYNIDYDIIYGIYSDFNNDISFKSGFLIGSGVTLMSCGTIIILLGIYNTIKYDYKK